LGRSGQGSPYIEGRLGKREAFYKNDRRRTLFALWERARLNLPGLITPEPKKRRLPGRHLWEVRRDRDYMDRKAVQRDHRQGGKPSGGWVVLEKIRDCAGQSRKITT